MWFADGNLAVMSGFVMTFAKHSMQAELHGPSKQAIYPYSSGEPIFDAVRQACSRACRLKFVAMNPSGERPHDLFVDEEAVLLYAVCRAVHCNGPIFSSTSEPVSIPPVLRITRIGGKAGLNSRRASSLSWNPNTVSTGALIVTLLINVGIASGVGPSSGGGRVRPLRCAKLWRETAPFALLRSKTEFWTG